MELTLETGISESGETTVLDFSALGLHAEVAVALKRALRAELGHNLPSTQSKAFFALKIFSKYLRERGHHLLCPLPIDVVSDFADWLDRSQRGPSAQVVLNTTCRLLSWCQRNVKGIVHPRATFWVSVIRDTNNPKRVPSTPDLKMVLEGCYTAITEVEERMATRRRLVAGRELKDGEATLSNLIRELLALGHGALPRQRLVNRSGNALARRIEDHGGYRKLARLIWLCPEDIFPFYLAILTQTSGNPDAIKALSRQCIHQHPIRSDLERVQWIKKRGSKEQYADFPTGRKWSAPGLVRRLLALNGELIAGCRGVDVDKLFICYNPHYRTIRVPNTSQFLDQLESFTQANGLAPFQFRDLRHAGARAHHQAAGSIFAAKHRLNHNSVDSTLRYSSLRDRAVEHDLLIRQFQGEMVRLSTQPPVALNPVEVYTQGSADTVFGFRCKDPLSGTVPGSARGRTCLQFSRCATCPGALVVLDDPKVIARLMATRSALELARKRAIAEGWWPRYELLYEPTYLILTKQIIPAVHASVLAEASEIDVVRLIPVLE